MSSIHYCGIPIHGPTSDIAPVSETQWAKPHNRPQCLQAWRAEDSPQPAFKSRSGSFSVRLD